MQHGLNESHPHFRPEALHLQSAPLAANDVTVIGRIEPRAHVKDYFLGDGLTLRFDLSRVPFTRRSQRILEEEFSGATFEPLRWSVATPGAFSVSGGQLHVSVASAADGSATVEFRERLDLGGALVLQHGEINFPNAVDAVIGGLYPGAIQASGCTAGFRVRPNGGACDIRPLIEGVETGTTLTTVAGHRYALTTRIHASEHFRMTQVVRSSGTAYGGASISAKARVVLEVHDIDPANPGSLAAPSLVLLDGIIASLPAFARYVLVNAMAGEMQIRYTRLSRTVDAEVRTTIPGQSTRTRLVGAVSEGGECGVFDIPQLRFHSQHVPVSGEKIGVSYRGRGRALARVRDEASVTTAGERRRAFRAGAPASRTAAECEQWALAVLDDTTGTAWSGRYETYSLLLPAGASSDVWPGDEVSVSAPSRGAEFTATIREVRIEAVDLADDTSCYTLEFANDAAVPLALEYEPASVAELPEVTPAFVADLPDAQVTTVTSTTVTIDAGSAPVAGGGIEVRRSDTGWGTTADRNLVGRFTTQVFTVPRLSRVQDYFVRQYDAGAPPRYSRYSAALHVDMPL